MRKIVTSLLGLSILLGGPVSAGTDEEVRAVFDRFVAAQNAHDVAAVREVLVDSPDFLWITRGSAIWGRDAAAERFASLYQGTWHLAPDMKSLKVITLGDAAAQLFVPIRFSIGAAGQPATDSLFLMNQTLVKTTGGWRIASILPIPSPPPAPAPAK